MHLDLFNESFFFCPRSDLESLQLVRRSLLNVIVAGSNVLPLRPIDRVVMDCDGDAKDYIDIFVKDPTAGGSRKPDYEASVRDGDFAEIFRRLQNTCIKEVNVGIRDSPFLCYWKSQEAAVFTVVSIDFDLPDDTDYGLLDSIVNHLRPKSTGVYVRESSWQENGRYSEHLKVLARDSFLNNVQTCRLDICGDAFPPPSFVLEEPGYQNYELWCKDSNGAHRIDGFMLSFLRDGFTNKKLESVCIHWNDDDDLPLMPKQLSKPTKIEMPLPKNDLTSLLTRYVHQVTQCETQSFVLTKQWKRMEVYKWSVEYDDDEYGRCAAHVLQCLVKTL